MNDDFYDNAPCMFCGFRFLGGISDELGKLSLWFSAWRSRGICIMDHLGIRDHDTAEAGEEVSSETFTIVDTRTSRASESGTP